MRTSIWRTVRAMMLSMTGPRSSCRRWISSTMSSFTCRAARQYACAFGRAHQRSPWLLKQDGWERT